MVPVTVPLLTRSPFKVSREVDISRVAVVFTVSVEAVVNAAPSVSLDPVLIVSGTVEPNVFAALVVMLPVLAIVTPPVAAKVLIHSAPAVRSVAVL